MATYTNFISGFNITTGSSIDKRLLLSKEEMKSLRYKDPDPLTGKFSIINLPDFYFCLCVDDEKLYTFNSANEEDPETGKFRLLAGGETKEEYIKEARVEGTVLTLIKNDDSQIVYSIDLDSKQDKLSAENAGDNITITVVDGITKINAVSDGKDKRFEINDPENNQLLIYDANKDKWINKDLTSNSIELDQSKLNITGFGSAFNGEMPTKGDDGKLRWKQPVSDSELQEYVSAASASALQASNYASQAGSKATEAGIAAQNAEIINNRTMQWVNDKFWWGDINEYNALTEIYPDTFYYIIPEV